MQDYHPSNLSAETIAVNDDVTTDDKQITGKQNKSTVTVLLAVLFLFGLLLGVLYIANADSSVLTMLDYLFFSSIETRMNHSFPLIFVASVTSSFLFLLASFLGGLTMWGSLFVPLLSILRGFGLGMTAGHVYSFGVAGVFYQILVVLPGAMFSCFAVLFSAKESIYFSRQLNHVHHIRRNPKLYAPQPSVQNYAIRIGILSCLALFGALLDVFATLLFSGIFQTSFYK